MKNFSIAVFVICAKLGIAYGQQGQKKSAHDPIVWKTVADQFMSESVGNRTDKALDLMELEFIIAPRHEAGLPQPTVGASLAFRPGSEIIAIVDAMIKAERQDGVARETER